MLGNLFKRSKGPSGDTDKVAALERLIEQPPSAHDIASIYPIIVPLECMDLNWPGPIEQIGQLPLALTWAIVNKENLWLYVTFEQGSFWETANLKWKEAAFQNLGRLASEGGFGGKLDDDGSLFVRVMLQPDAMGPSRLLVPRLFDHELGADYMVALPERTCAIAYRADVTGQQLSDVNAMIDSCFERGTEPVSPRRFRASEFWHPAAMYGLSS